MSLNETTAGRPAVIDRYQVRELLGQGAFGAVYRTSTRGWSATWRSRCCIPDA